ncbi:MAG: NADH-quinone oxidoreductase subunit M [Sphingobacteriia bacterium]|nr:NADH-quinone oxidoreductase subunit M [Sphingobacteriia bacterium]
MINFPLLSVLIYLPLICAGILLFFFNNKNIANIKQAKILTLSVTIINFIISLIAAVISLGIINNPLSSTSYPNFVFLEYYGNATPILGVDGMALSLIVLTTFLMPLCILASEKIKERTVFFLISFLVLESIIIGVFSSLDLLLFYILFEASLIPMFLIIGIWGGDNRIYAAFKFFLYTFLGSVFLLIAIIYLYSQFKTFDIWTLTINARNLPFDIQQYLWFAMFASFAVKVPMFPVHTWLPDAHVQAPTAGSVILAGILLKLGGYGFLRFSIPMFPEASVYYADFVSVLSIIAIIYASIVAFAQKDMKKMIAYSSIAHMGYVTIGIFTTAKGFDLTNKTLVITNETGFYGAIFQMISHGIVSAALFLVVGSLYDRMHTKEIAAYGGVAERMPLLATFFMVFMLASVGLPGTSGFVGEFLVILSVFNNYSTIAATFVAFGVIVGAMYMLSLYARTMFGEIKNSNVITLEDLKMREIVIFAPLAILTIVLGFYPSLVNNILHSSIKNLQPIATVLNLK